VCLAALFLPDSSGGWLSRRMQNGSRVTTVLSKLISAVRIFRRRPMVLVATLAVSIASQTVMCVGLWLVAQGLPGAKPSLGEHILIVPMAMITGVLPLPLSGLGAFEGALDFLYRTIPPATVVVARGQGLLVALVYRLITIGIALIGAIYYLTARKEFAATLSTSAQESRQSVANVGRPDSLDSSTSVAAST
jgi:hypothetical protein